MGACLCFREIVLRPAGHDLFAMFQVEQQHPFEGKGARFAIYQRQHSDPEGGLQRRQAEQFAEHIVGVDVPRHFHHHPHALPVRFVPKVGYAVDLPIPGELSYPLDEPGFVGLVRDLSYHDVGLAPLPRFDVDGALHVEFSPAAGIGVGDQVVAVFVVLVDDTACREVRAFHEPEQLFHGHLFGVLPFFDQVHESIDDLAQVVGWDVARHSDGDPARPVDQEVRQRRREHLRLLQRAVEVRDVVHGVFFDVLQHHHAEGGEPRFRVSHGCRAIPVDGAEVSLTIHQWVAKGEILRHAGHGVVHRSVAVRMVLTKHLSDDPRALAVWLVWRKPHGVHGVEDSPVNRLQPVPDVWERPCDDHAHGVIQVRCPHFFFDSDFSHALWHQNLLQTKPATLRGLRRSADENDF